jgi:hypothetical protein
MPIIAARRAHDDWLHYASRPRLEPFVKLARRIRRYRNSIEATIEWGFTNHRFWCAPALDSRVPHPTPLSSEAPKNNGEGRLLVSTLAAGSPR